MADVKWTDAQKNAINARGGPLLVSAAAGSGKTAVLVARIVDIITDSDHPCDVDRFLVVTYTNAAAEEMKQRIAGRLSAMLQSDPFNENLLRQQLLLSKAQISTIHGFCRTIAKEYFHLLDIPSDFRIADEQELELLTDSAVTEVFDTYYDSGNEDFLRAVDIFSGSHDDGNLKEIVLKLYEFLRSQPFPERWINEKLSLYENVSDPGRSIWGRQLADYALLSLEFIRSRNERSLERASESELYEKKYAPALESDKAMIDRLCALFEKGVWDDICNYVKSIKYTAIGRQKIAAEDIAETAIKDEVTEIRKKYKAEIDKLRSYFSVGGESFKREISDMLPTARILFDLVRDFEREYARLKTERSAADFSDLEHWALRLLVRDTDEGPVPTEAAREISKRFDYVMVDEYQDANKIQDTIFNAVSDGDKKLFVVGDVKQSIYRFRQAMPEIFIARKDSCTLYDPDSESYPSKIILDANFRSRSGVTDCVNFVFSKVMSQRAGELDYTEEESLKPKAAYPEDTGAAASFHLIGTGSGTSDERCAAEARYIGGLIYKMMNEERVFDSGEMRRPTFGDFAVLLRSIGGSGGIYVKELMKMGIPASGSDGDEFMAQSEIKLMLSLLRALDNPARDIPLAAALMSPIFGFTAEDIARLRAGKKDIPLYTLLTEASAADEKAAHFTELFDELHSCAVNMPADKLIHRVYELTLLPEIVLSEPGDDGEFRRKNLLLLYRYAKKYESSGFKGISGFIGFVDRLTENGGELAAADRGEAQTNCVRIMTIHKSKGLEFPICIVGGLGKEFNKKSLREPIIFSSELGIGLNIFNSEKMYRYKGLTRMAVENAMSNAFVSEELRVLYVALTRAKERLVLVASASDAEKKLLGAAGKLIYGRGKVSPFSVLKADDFSDILLECLLVSRSGEKLRQTAGYDGETDENDTSRWDITYLPESEQPAADDCESDGEQPQPEPRPEHKKPDERTVVTELEDIRRRLSVRYPYARDCLIPVKAAASSVAHMESGVSFGAAKKPAFMSDGGLSAAQKGTALHTFVQHCGLDTSMLSIEDEKARLVAKGFLTQREADSISNERVMRFLDSPLAQEMREADLTEREYRFTVEIPAKMADRTLLPPEGDEKIILQGAIDCFFEKDGELTIVDYKTDRVKLADELSQRYASQLALYKYALEQIFEKEVARCVIYSFALDEEIEVDVE